MFQISLHHNLFTKKWILKKLNINIFIQWQGSNNNNKKNILLMFNTHYLHQHSTWKTYNMQSRTLNCVGCSFECTYRSDWKLHKCVDFWRVSKHQSFWVSLCEVPWDSTECTWWNKNEMIANHQNELIIHQISPDLRVRSYNAN